VLKKEKIQAKDGGRKRWPDSTQNFSVAKKNNFFYKFQSNEESNKG
jgi:hypothetical protein